MKQTQKKASKRGFTLIEILIVIGIIAILAAIVLVAVNPAKQFAEANDAQRSSNVNAILNAIGQYVVDNKGEIPSVIPNGTAAEADNEISSDEIDLCSILVPDYISALPADPGEDVQSITDCDDYVTGYHVYKDSTSNRISVEAPNVSSYFDGDLIIAR